MCTEMKSLETAICGTPTSSRKRTRYESTSAILEIEHAQQKQFGMLFKQNQEANEERKRFNNLFEQYLSKM